MSLYRLRAGREPACLCVARGACALGRFGVNADVGGGRSSSGMVYRMAWQGIKGVGVVAMRQRIRIKGEKRWT
jgi:hypothetical protein